MFIETAADHVDNVVAVSIIPQRVIGNVLVAKCIKNVYYIVENLIGRDGMLGRDSFSVGDNNSKSLTMPCFRHC